MDYLLQYSLCRSPLLTSASKLGSFQHRIFHRTIGTNALLMATGVKDRDEWFLRSREHISFREIGKIDRFHVTSSLSKIQNERATKVFVLIRHKRRYIYICLRFYSSIACFVGNPEHFEFQGYGDAWHKAMIEFVEKYILIPWFWAFLEVEALGKVLM